jgi:hypothetical protein
LWKFCEPDCNFSAISFISRIACTCCIWSRSYSIIIVLKYITFSV